MPWALLLALVEIVILTASGASTNDRTIFQVALVRTKHSIPITRHHGSRCPSPHLHCGIIHVLTLQVALRLKGRGDIGSQAYVGAGRATHNCFHVYSFEK